MSAVLEKPRPEHGTLPSRSHLDWLESEAIFILREVAGECANPVLFFSGGKDSIVLLRLAEKAFRPAKFPFPLMHVDTGHNFPEVIAFRDARAAELGERLIVHSVEDSIRRGTVKLRRFDESRNAAQSVTLLEAIAEFGFDAAIGGARRDEEKARAKERVFSFRDEFGQWDPKNQRPELWSLYNTRVAKGEHMRVFPISNWTELDVWQYLSRERLEVPSIYYAPQAGSAPQRPARSSDGDHAAACRRDGRRVVGPLPHRGGHQLHLPGRIRRGDCRRGHRRDCADHRHRTRRDAYGRPDFRSVHGAAQEGRVLLT